ncbi:MAG: aminotransferase class I/II-fold pyridoxal phosphate-dependent enzyme [Bacteroidetes bacterium]|nr:aminotransferase class I/II-fold pyridoxal phosphate-dependent enzyme [Bacteroidota bacterium]MBP7397999.1 aminotransferase class I/II-fold pyridoxal phosphate-dependent enzyme [Chitinophagales bacterium]MBK7108561.1 aminotransferase class I/II-fold pyridoxal phosphate-dependent enzyme [Bacteroidota bacterium]MBK8489114.1 aminotransferase class I/II-fold pyridoxal phosphate-dependent enzyme [Bacteroidota bacterium]MBK8680963.1 aminotransferase class I/II-fold pyridoxal phosphate-dependent en
MDISYIINSLGEERSNYFNAVTPPIVQTSNFAFPTVEDLRNAMQQEMTSHLYTRGNNPTVEIVRKKIAALEQTEDALLFSSGVAAVAAAVMHVVKQGDHVVCVRNPYSWTKYLLDEILVRFGITITYVDGRETKNFEHAIQKNTTLIFLESPNTFLLELQDIKAVTSLAKAKKIRTIIDNSYTTPLFQNPHVLGVDIVMHTATKYLAGHSDVVAGVLCADKETIAAIFKNEFMCFGAIPSPHDAWLLLRGLRTLELRLERSAANAKALTHYLAQHPKVEKIIYPHHPSHDQHTLALQQMKNSSGLFSMLLKTNDQQKIELFCNALKRFLLAVSWGGHESLVFPACASAHTQYPINFIRFYTGIEQTDVLLQDVEEALRLI